MSYYISLDRKLESRFSSERWRRWGSRREDVLVKSEGGLLFRAAKVSEAKPRKLRKGKKLKGSS